MRVFDPERAARALLDAAIIGDAGAIKRHRITRQTLHRWRVRLGEDPVLRHKVTERKAMIDQRWGEQLDEAIADHLNFLQRASKDASVLDPETIVAMTGSLKTLADIRLTVRMLDAGDVPTPGKPATADRATTRAVRAVR